MKRKKSTLRLSKSSSLSKEVITKKSKKIIWFKPFIIKKLKYEGIKAHNIKLLDDWTQDDDDAELNNRYNDVLNPMTNRKIRKT